MMGDQRYFGKANDRTLDAPFCTRVSAPFGNKNARKHGVYTREVVKAHQKATELIRRPSALPERFE